MDKTFPNFCLEKANHFSLQVWQPLQMWLAWGSPKIHVFISHGLEGRSKWASGLCNHDRCLCPGRTQSLTSGLTCFSPLLLLTLPASEHFSWVGESSRRVLVEAEPSLPLVKFKSPMLVLLALRLANQCLVFNQEQVMQKGRTVNYAANDSDSGHMLCLLTGVLVAENLLKWYFT